MKRRLLLLTIIALITGCSDSDPFETGLDLEKHTIEVNGEVIEVHTTRDIDLTEEELKEMFSEDDMQTFLHDD